MICRLLKQPNQERLDHGNIKLDRFCLRPIQHMFVLFQNIVLKFCHLFNVTDIVNIEKVQKYYTKRISSISNLSYKQRLECLKVDSLELRRLYFDMRKVYNIIHGLMLHLMISTKSSLLASTLTQICQWMLSLTPFVVHVTIKSGRLGRSVRIYLQIQLKPCRAASWDLGLTTATLCCTESLQKTCRNYRESRTIQLGSHSWRLDARQLNHC